MRQKETTKLVQHISQSTKNAKGLRSFKSISKKLLKEAVKETKRTVPNSQKEEKAQTTTNLHSINYLINEQLTRKEPSKPEAMDDLEEHLMENYCLRYNLLSGITEYKLNNAPSSCYKGVDKREENTLFIELERAGIECRERDFHRFIHSAYIPPYHPFQEYLKELPQWDQTDRLTDLAKRVSSDENWIENFHRWMLALTIQWIGITGEHANSTAPILISEEQGWMKSTFCMSLMPKQLRPYYTDQIDISKNSQERKLAVMGIINLDEFDRLSPKHMAQLKNLMQLSVLNMKQAYHQNYQQLPRIASFIGTSNRKDLLTDPTGSRRFICVEVEHPIDCTHIDLDQIYAQLVSELRSGARYWFNHEEEAIIQEHNKKYYRITPEEELFRSHFRAPEPNEKYLLLSLSEIMTTIQHYHNSVMRNLNLSRFGSTIVAAGIERIHTKEGNRYKVVKINPSRR